MAKINLKAHKAKNTLIKKAIAFVLLCVLLIVLDKVYTLKPSNLSNQYLTVNK